MDTIYKHISRLAKKAEALSFGIIGGRIKSGEQRKSVAFGIYTKNLCGFFNIQTNVTDPNLRVDVYLNTSHGLNAKNSSVPLLSNIGVLQNSPQGFVNNHLIPSIKIDYPFYGEELFTVSLSRELTENEIFDFSLKFEEFSNEGIL